MAALLEAGWWEGRYRSRKTSEKATARIPALTGTAAVEAGKVARLWMYVEGRAGSVSDGFFVRCGRKSVSNQKGELPFAEMGKSLRPAGLGADWELALAFGSLGCSLGI